jgi:uncharacterized protein (TIRG00374 family)
VVDRIDHLAADLMWTLHRLQTLTTRLFARTSLGFKRFWLHDDGLTAGFLARGGRGVCPSGVPGDGVPVALGDRMRWRRMIMLIVGLAASALAVQLLFDRSDELLMALDTLASVSMEWVVAAILAEVLSYTIWGAAVAMILRRGGGKIGPITLGAAALAGDAAAYCLPFGFATLSVVLFDVLRRRQINAVLAAWALAVCTVLDIGALMVITFSAVQILGINGAVPGFQTTAIVLLTALGLVCAAYMVSRQPMLWNHITRPLKAASSIMARRIVPAALNTHHFEQILRRMRSPIVKIRRDWVRQLHTIRLTPAAGIAAFALLMLCWITDIAVLALAFLALHATPPWTGLLLAYCAGQIAASTPVTPGGLGIVEGSIAVTLIALGNPHTSTLAAVLLYRLIVYWGCIPAGGLAWLVLRATSRPPAIPAPALLPHK